jgi:uncharacterized protein YacL
MPREAIALLKLFGEFFFGTSKLVWTVRYVLFILTVGIAVDIAADAAIHAAEGERLQRIFHVIGVILIGAFCVGAAALFALSAVSLDYATKDKDITTLSSTGFGLLGGLAIGWLFWIAVQPIVHQYLTSFGISVERSPRIERTMQLLVTILACYIAISALLQTKDEFRFIIPYVEFQKQLKGAKPLVLDTSVIIDGRIADICDTGIIDTKLIVPRFVLQELQSIADSSDKIRRNRGRRGLDVLKRMQSNPKIEMQMHEGNLPELREVQKVDERLVVLAKALSGRVVTNDFNLNKISQLQGVDVINLNELSNALKLVALPGELLTVKIVKQGDQIGQGVGYLDDGTMVVVEQGRQAIGQEVGITVTSVLQTPAGRMIFGRVSSTGEYAALK